MINRLGKIEINKLKMETSIDDFFNLHIGQDNQYLHVSHYRDFRGILIEINSDKKEEPIKGQITLSYNEYSFCNKIKRQLAQYDPTIFDLDQIVIN